MGRTKVRKVNMDTLIESLKRGQDQPLLISDKGVYIDGHKRRLLYGSQFLEEVTKHHDTVEQVLEDMIGHTSIPETKESIRMKSEEVKKLIPNIGKEELVEILMVLSNKSERTIYRWLEIPLPNDSKKVSKKTLREVLENVRDQVLEWCVDNQETKQYNKMKNICELITEILRDETW